MVFLQIGGVVFGGDGAKLSFALYRVVLED